MSQESTLRHARVTNSHEQELRRFLGIDLLVIDDFCLDQMDPQESRDAYEMLVPYCRKPARPRPSWDILCIGSL